MTEGRLTQLSSWRLFLLRRLMGLASIADGFCYLLTPYKSGLAYKTAKSIARENWRLRRG